MSRTLFDHGWEWTRSDAASWRGVDLPHDAMLHEQRSATTDNGSHTGWFPGGTYVYRRTWRAPADPGRVSLFFEGVYRKARVLVNGTEAGGCLGGYTEFEVRIDHLIERGSNNLIEVHVDNSEGPNSRWYSGSGIYRHVWLLEQGPVRIRPGGVHLVTRSLGATATVAATVELDNDERRPVEVAVSLRREGSRAEASARVDGAAVALELQVPDARPWSAERPDLYDVTVEVIADGEVLDRQELRTGLRTVEVDAARGLRINGVTTLLRGACVHHDSGILGGATFRAAEFRRARILKEQGFNAIRSSHNPLSRDMLDACDEVGLYVMDESTDVWFRTKTAHDAALHFAETWEADLESMVRKDRCHPSVIMYSIGNEVAESGTPEGIEAARLMVAHVKKFDDSVPVTAGINLMLNMSAAKGKNVFEGHEKQNEKNKQGAAAARPRRNALTSTGYNLLVSKMGSLMAKAAALPAADKASRGVFDVLDVAGYNYAHARYRKDGKLHPRRVIVGTETMPFHIAGNWAMVKELPYVVGDFMWTGWDYLGEAGIGTWTYGDESSAFAKPYPYLAAGPGAIDITGVPGAPMALARAVWEQTDEPAVFVRPLDRDTRRTNRAAWRATDAVASWAWPAGDGRRAEIEVYSSADEVELLLDGRSLGVKRAGRRAGFVARFRTPYQRGTLEAIARRQGREVGRSALASAAGSLRLRVQPDRSVLDADGQDLAHLAIELVDGAGTVVMLSGEEVEVVVDGPATLAGLGSADPAPLGSYTDPRDQLFRGRALAVIRATTEPGDVRVSVRSRAHGEAVATLTTTVPTPRGVLTHA
ncbi:glycoside hydrolase family 2 TIM barrel-domain containing protein [Tessaracoccus sp. G1721]